MLPQNDLRGKRYLDMRKAVLAVSVVFLLAFLGGASAFAQQAGAATPQTKPKAKTAHHAMHHAAHHAANAYARYQRGVHTLSGTISTVDPNGKLLIVKGADGVPFDFVVRPRTHIEVKGQKSDLGSLSDQANQQVTVKYRDDLRRGLVAQSVAVG
jgi:hypothetical protein